MGAQTGNDADSFRAVYEASYGAIHAYAARRVGRELADEVAAETFLVAWRRREVLPPDMLPWLYGIARNMVAKQRSAAGRRQLTDVALHHERPPNDPASPESGDPELWDAWDQLRPADREVLSLVAWEELSVAQAARAMGCPAAVFSVRLHRARRRMERLLSRRPFQSVSTTELSEA